MTTFKIDNMHNDYVSICQRVMNTGKPVAPRDEPTHEILGATIELSNPKYSLPYGVNRNFSPRIAAAEALQLIGGVSYPETMLKIAPQFANFMDGGTFHGAYGPRIRQQMPLVIERLRKDPDTRQAVVTIWDPAKDLLEDGLHDYPCTLGFQFVIRNGRLSMITTMRSNDVWWGLAHDIFQFTQLQMTVANVLGIPYGTYYHRSNSLHAYERDFADIARMRRTTATPFKVLRIPEGLKGDSWEEVRRTAELLISGASSEVYPESWYVEALGL